MYSFTLSEVVEKIYDGTVACNVDKTDGNYTMVTVICDEICEVSLTVILTILTL